MKLTKELKEQAHDICENNGYSELWINVDGDMFTTDNLALLSVNQKKDKVCKYTHADPEDTEDTELSKSELLQKIRQEIDELEAADYDSNDDLAKATQKVNELEEQAALLEEEIEKEEEQ